MRQNPNQRVVYLDLLRIMATFAVIVVHASASKFYSFSFSRNWYASVVYDSMVRWCVPVFVMISGALFLNDERNITCYEIAKKRIPRLLLAYCFWTIVYYFLKVYHGEFSMRGLCSSYFHLWYLPMMMGVYLFIPVLRKIVQDKTIIVYVLIIWFGYLSMGFFQFVTLFKLFGHFWTLFNINTVVEFVGYFLLGYFLSKHTFRTKQKIGIYVIGMLGALSTIIGTLHLSISKGDANERFFVYHSPNVILMALALFVLIKEMNSIFGKTIIRFVEFVRKDLFGIYLVHVIWLDYVDTISFFQNYSNFISIPIISIIVFLLSLFTTKLIRLVPYLRKVVE